LRLSLSRRREALSAPYPSRPEASDVSHGEQRWDVSKTLVAGGAAVVLVVGGLIYMQHGETGANRAEPPAGQSVSGTIDAKPLASHADAQPRNAAGAVAPSPAVSRAVSPAVSAALSPAPQVAPSREAALLNGSVADNLQAARDAIDHGDLTTARRRFSKIPMAQQDMAGVQRTQAELVSLERARDDSLRLARACEATGSWTCVRQNARDVLAIDASNVEAQTLVEHAIESSGWLNQPTRPARVAVPRTVVAAPTRAATPAAAIPAPRATPSAAAPPRIATPTRTFVAVPQPHPAAAQNSATPDASTSTGAPAISRAPLSTDGSPVATGSHAALSSTAEPAESAPTAARQPSAMPPLLTATPPEPARADTTSTSPPAPSPAPIRAAAVDSPAPVITPPASAQAPVTPHAPSFDSGNADERERAIKEYGWKNQPQTPSSPSQ
jgi:hypothetical protein